MTEKNMEFDIRILTEKSLIIEHWALLRQLNQAVTEAYLAEIMDDMLAHGYRFITVWDGASCIGVTGLWTGTKIYSGKYMELDNVVIDAAHRSRGIGQLLLDFVVDLAHKEGVRTLMLDAYHENHGAKAFYERNAFVARGYHFLRFLS
jgi:GNAT superfamily N-acetyltransferase